MTEIRQNIETTIALLNKIETKLLDIAKAEQKAFDDIGDPKTLKELKDLEKAIDDLNKSTHTLKENKKDQEKLNKQLAKQTDEEVKGKLKLQKANAEQRKILKDILILQDENAGTLQKVAAQSRQLRLEREKLNLETQEGQDRLTEINKQLDENNQLILDNSDKLKKQRLNVGNYQSALDGLTDSYEDQQKRLKILTDAYKDSVAQGKKNTKGAKELKKELEEQKEVLKEVEKATKSAEKSSKKFGSAAKALGIGAVIAIISKLADLFGSSREATIEADKKMAVFTETIKTFFAALVNSWDGFKVILSSLGESTQSFFINFEKGWLNLLISIEKGKGFFSDTEKEVSNLEGQLKLLNDKQKELSESSNTLSGGYDSIIEAFKNTGKVTENAIDFQQKYLELQLKTKIEIEAQTRALGGLAEMRQILQDISDDDTLGFVTRNKAVKESQEIAEEFAKREIELAELKETLTIQDIKGQLLRAKVISDADLSAIKSGEQLNDLLKDRAIALKISDDSEAAFTEAFVERKDKEVEALSFSRDQEEKNRKTFRDSYEQRLDIIEEFGELQFSINEEGVNNEKKSQEERAKILEKNRKLSQDIFAEGIELTIEQGKKSIDLNKELSDSEKEVAKAKLDAIDVQKILNTSSEQERFELIRKLDLGEIEEKRLKETFKIKFEQNRALIEQQQTLNESELDAQNIREEIALQEIALKETTQKKLDDLDKGLLDLEKENLKKRIELLEEDSIERLNLEKELNDMLLDEKSIKLEKEKALEEKALENQKELSNAALTILENSLNKRSEKKLAELDKEEEGIKNNQEKLEELAAQGDKNALESAAISTKRQAEIEREREQQVRRAQRNEIILAGIKSFANSQDSAKTLTEMAQLVAGLSALDLPSAFDGFDDSGEGGKLDSKGGFLMIGHPKEQMHSYADRKEMADPKTGKLRSRKDLKEIVNYFDKGGLNTSDIMPNIEIGQKRYEDSNELLKRVESVENALKSLPKEFGKHIPTGEAMFDEFHKALIYTSKKGDNIIKKGYLFD